MFIIQTILANPKPIYDSVYKLISIINKAKAPLPTFVAVNLKRVPDTPVADTDLCALTVNVLSLKNQLDDLIFMMVVFADLKSQVVDLKMQSAANQTSTHEVRSDLLSLKSEMSSLSIKLMSLKSGLTHVPNVPHGQT